MSKWVAKPVSQRMSNVFIVSVLLMLAHKLECWWMHEWLDAPFFIYLYESGGILAQTPEDAFGEVVFLSFITWLFAGLFMSFLLMRGGWGALVALGIWGLTGILEWHHLLKSLARGEYYVGLGTSLVYLAFMMFYWWELSMLIEKDDEHA